MTRKVSMSRTGQNQKPPTREERDAASSIDEGRKAVEVPIEKLNRENRAKQDGKANHSCSKLGSDLEKLAEPVGLQLETAADQYRHDK